MNIDIISVIGLGLIAAILALFLRQHRSEYRILISLGSSVLLISYLIGAIADITDNISGILSATFLSDDLMRIILKSLGICILIELAGQTCRDVGEGAIASKIELAGKIALLVVAAPLFVELLEDVGEILLL